MTPSTDRPGGVDLLAFGGIFLEIVFGTIPALPGPGEEVFSDQFALSCGGAISVASAAAESGALAGLATVLGDDLGATVAREHCRRLGIDLSGARRVAGATSGISVVVNFDGDRAFISHLPDGGDREGEEAAASWWSAEIRRQRPRWIYLHARPEALAVIEVARETGCRVALDTELGSIRTRPDVVRRCVALADLFVPNQRELLELAGVDDIGAAAAEVAPPGTVVVVKQGAAGAVVVTNGSSVASTAGLATVDVADRTGAGDAFAGALIGSLALGADMATAVEAGNAAGSRAVSRLGALGPIETSGTRIETGTRIERTEETTP